MGKYADKILRIIRSHEGHLTVEQIYEALKIEEPHVVLATVYNNVNRLTDDGLVRRVSVSGYPDRYDDVSRHDHLVCVMCGSLQDIVLRDLTNEICARIQGRVLSYDLMVRYICPACQNRMKNASLQKEKYMEE